MNQSAVTFDDSIRITASGYFHIRLFPERLEYLYGILPTTPFTERHTGIAITRILRKEQETAAGVPGSIKARAAQQLYDYLMRERRKLRKRATGAAELDGSKYVLDHMAKALDAF